MPAVQIIGAFPADLATADQLAARTTELAVYRLPPTALDDFAAKIKAVDRAQVRQIAQKYFRPENLLVVVVGDRATSETALRRIAVVETRDVDGNLIRPRQPQRRGPHHGKVLGMTASKGAIKSAADSADGKVQERLAFSRLQPA